MKAAAAIPAQIKKRKELEKTNASLSDVPNESEIQEAMKLVKIWAAGKEKRVWG